MAAVAVVVAAALALADSAAVEWLESAAAEWLELAAVAWACVAAVVPADALAAVVDLVASADVEAAAWDDSPEVRVAEPMKESVAALLLAKLVALLGKAVVKAVDSAGEAKVVSADLVDSAEALADLAVEEVWVDLPDRAAAWVCQAEWAKESEAAL